MQKLLIVDGSNLLFQMFYGMPARIVGKSGRPCTELLALWARL